MSTVTRYAYNTEVTSTIVALWCVECGVPFGLAESFIAARREDHERWYCPNGHGQSYTGDNEAERLRKKVQLAEAERDRQRVRANGERVQRERAERQRAAAKGQVTRIKNRVANGVCPCCSRTFVDLARHMAGQHPDYTAKDES